MRYLVAVDGSAEADAAVEYAATHAVTFGATLELAHVLTPETKLVDGEVVLSGGSKAIRLGERTLQEARGIAADVAARHDADLTVESQLLAGSPADSVVKHAEETGSDAIYVGHRGLSEEQEGPVGSVAQRVVNRATVPVTVMR
jgi:nucleotide-binding universal stress UspA family protein